MKRISLGAAIVIAFSLTNATLRADAPATQPAQSRMNEANLIVTRTDVARAFLSFERVLHAHPMAEDQQRAVNRDFDQLANDFAMRRHSAVVRELHRLSDLLAPNAPETPQSADAKLARAMRVRIAPLVANNQRPSLLRVRVTPLYSSAIDQPTALHLTITPVESAEKNPKPVIDREIQVHPSGMTPVLNIEQPADLEVGHYRVELVSKDGYRAPACDWYVADKNIEMVRQANVQSLRVFTPGSDQLAAAMSSVSARNGLLSAEISEGDSARMLTDPVKLSDQLDHEIADLQNDRDPFVDRAGDYWRTITLGGTHVAARVYAPQSALDGKKVPLVIALHGAGGDENLFMEGYGLGEIKRQADKHGFLLITPRTDFAIVAPDAVDGIVRALSYDYLIDRSRVYVIGHSLGAIAAQKWSERWGGKLAGVCQLSGATPFALNAKMPPTLLYGAELDPLFPASRIEELASDAKRMNLPVEFRNVPARGHTLYVNDVLPQAIDWLMQQHRGDAPNAAPTTAPTTQPAPNR